MHKQWIVCPRSPEAITAAKAWGVSPVVAQVLINRGHSPSRPVLGFRNPQLAALEPPDNLHGTVEAAEAIAAAIANGSRIVLYGDYDVDGITGLAILWHVLRIAGADVDFYVPHRVDEGYGLNLPAAEKLVRQGARMIVTVDCGITACDVGARLAELHVPLIITDHHVASDPLPTATAIVHPALGSSPASRHLSGAGVAFKLAWAITQRLNGGARAPSPYRDVLLAMLPLAALGTIADVVPLCDENRILAVHGLRGIGRTALPGLRALLDGSGLNDRRIDDYDVGFRLAPRLNAAGRMGHAALAVELLTRADEERAKKIVAFLESHNDSRQTEERRILREAVEIIERDRLAGDNRRAIVVACDGWHPGVIGIVAARLVSRYLRPAVVLALTGEEGQGSGRSIEHFNLGDALAACSAHLLAHGGHAMAAGLRLRRAQVPAFAEAFIELANNRLTGNDLRQKLHLDGELALQELPLTVAEELVSLGPFGIGNPRPKFATDWIELAGEPRCVGRRQEHLAASFRQNGAALRAIGFGQASRLEDLKQHRRCRAAFVPIINDFNGRRSVEMQLLDLKFA